MSRDEDVIRIAGYRKFVKMINADARLFNLLCEKPIEFREVEKCEVSHEHKCKSSVEKLQGEDN